MQEIDLHVYHVQVPGEERGRSGRFLYLSLQRRSFTRPMRLLSPDPTAALDIDLAYFPTPADLEAMCDGVELVARLVDRADGRRSRASEQPGALRHERDELRA